MSLVNWDIVTSPKEASGLGMRRARLKNVALMGKLLWSVLNEKNKLWVQVVSHKYLKNGTVCNSTPGTPPLVIWRGILKASTSLRDCFQFTIGSGSTSLWFSDFIGLDPICALLDYVHISDTELMLRDVWSNGKWNLNSPSTNLSLFIRDAILSTNIPAYVHDEVDNCWL